MFGTGHGGSSFAIWVLTGLAVYDLVHLWAVFDWTNGSIGLYVLTRVDTLWAHVFEFVKGWLWR